MRRHGIFGPTAGLCLGVATAAAQVPTQEMELLWQRVGVVDQIHFGGVSIFLGDVDKDGYDDVAHLAAVLREPFVQGEITILSGRDGRTLRSHGTPDRTYMYVQLTEAGDWDCDGWQDYAAYRYAFGFPYGPQIVEVRSGRDDRLLFEYKGPDDKKGPFVSMLGGLDVDGDRRPDLVVSRGLEISVFDNAGQLRYRLPTGSMPLARVGDLDRDGCDDFLIGVDVPPDRGGGCVLSGKTGKVLVSGYGDPGDGLGTGHVGGCGDVDADGVPDFYASSHGTVIFPGVVRVFSGRTGAPIYTWRYPVGSSFGHTVITGDFDQDGMPDLLVNAPIPVPKTGIIGSFFLLSLRTGEVVAHIPPPGNPPRSTGFGHLAAAGPAQPGSSFPVFVCSEPMYGKPAMWLRYEGSQTMLRALPLGVKSIGSACRGTLPAEPRIGLRNLGTTGVRIHLSGAPAGECSVLMFGLSSERFGRYLLPLPLDVIGFRGCKLLTSVEVTAARLTGRDGNDRGYAYVDVPWPLATQPSVVLHGQWVVLGQGPAAPGGLTGALSWPH